jgi:hypothetical protein
MATGRQLGMSYPTVAPWPIPALFDRYFTSAEPDVLVIVYPHEIHFMLPAEFGLSFSTRDKTTKSLRATEEADRLEVVNRNLELRDVNVQVLSRQLGWCCWTTAPFRRQRRIWKS